MARRLLRKTPLPCGCLKYEYERTATLPCGIVGNMPLFQQEAVIDEEVVRCQRCSPQAAFLKLSTPPEAIDLGQSRKIGWHWLAMLTATILFFYLTRWNR